MSLLAKLSELAISHYGARLAETPRLAQDALTLVLDTGAIVQARFAGPDEYSIQWRFGESEWRIDTAPLHRELPSSPNHLHDPDGRVRADPLTRPGHEPWHNLRAVIDAVLNDPLL